MRYIVLRLSAAFIMIAAGCGNRQDGAGGSGFIEADHAVVSAEISGRVESIFFDEGSSVENGDTLAVIDPSRVQLELKSSEAQRSVAEANLRSANLRVSRTAEAESFVLLERNRIEKLLASSTATQKQMDQIDFEYTQAVNAHQSALAEVAAIKAQIVQIDAGIDRLKRQLSDCYPIAPRHGVIVEKYIEKGELLGPGKAIAKIADLDSVWVKVYLAAGDFASVKIGDPASVSTETGETEFSGKVVWTSSEAEFTPKNIQTEESRANLVYAVKVRLANSNGRLKIGMPIYVTLGK
jgi:HlyD family secretion protein